MKCYIRFEKDGKYVQRRLTKNQIRCLYDLQFMLDESDETLKVNDMDKPFLELSATAAVLVDCIDDGHCYTTDKEGKLISTKHKFYHSGRRPSWKLKGDCICLPGDEH